MVLNYIVIIVFTMRINMRKSLYIITTTIVIFALVGIWFKNEIKAGDAVVVYTNGNVKVNVE